MVAPASTFVPSTNLYCVEQCSCCWHHAWVGGDGPVEAGCNDAKGSRCHGGSKGAARPGSGALGLFRTAATATTGKEEPQQVDDGDEGGCSEGDGVGEDAAHDAVAPIVDSEGLKIGVSNGLTNEW